MMFASYTPGTKSLRTLTQDDIDGICTIYPPSTGCGCTTTPRSNRSGAAVALIALVVLARRRLRYRRGGSIITV